MLISAPISVGELFDKISVLEIKIDKINKEIQLSMERGLKVNYDSKLENVRAERKMLLQLLDGIKGMVWPEDDFGALKDVNEVIWNAVDQLHIEDKKWLRNPWKMMRLASRISFQNDVRALLKRGLNKRFGSAVVEEKLYSTER